jgi:hypothetical protein
MCDVENWSFDDFSHSDTFSHTFWTLDGEQMISHFVDMVILVHRIGKESHSLDSAPQGFPKL